MYKFRDVQRFDVGFCGSSLQLLIPVPACRKVLPLHFFLRPPVIFQRVYHRSYLFTTVSGGGRRIHRIKRDIRTLSCPAYIKRSRGRGCFSLPPSFSLPLSSLPFSSSPLFPTLLLCHSPCQRFCRQKTTEIGEDSSDNIRECPAAR